MEQQCLWFGIRLVCYPQELQGGEEGEPWVSRCKQSLYPKERSCGGRKGLQRRKHGGHPMPGAV